MNNDDAGVSVDHGFSSPLAEAYRKAQNRISAMQSGKTKAAPVQQTHAPKPVPTVVETRTVPYKSQNDNIVEIPNENIPFEIAYPEDTRLMAVGMKAVSVDISEDSVSILICDEIKLKLPKLVPLRLTVNDCPYKVCWAGGMHKFGHFKHISFVILD